MLDVVPFHCRQLCAAAQPLLDRAQTQRARTGQKVHWAGESAHAAGSWTHERRVIYKAEALEQGPNVRFVVTTRTDPDLLALYA